MTRLGAEASLGWPGRRTGRTTSRPRRGPPRTRSRRGRSEGDVAGEAPAAPRATPRATPSWRRIMLLELVQRMGMRELRVDVVTTDPLLLNVYGGDVADLIGRRGENLRLAAVRAGPDAEQAAAPAHAGQRGRGRLPRPPGGAADRDGGALRRRVRSTGQPMQLEAMPPNERRIMHMALSEDPDVTTESVGEGDARRVVIKPRSAGRVASATAGQAPRVPGRRAHHARRDPGGAEGFVYGGTALFAALTASHLGHRAAILTRCAPEPGLAAHVQGLDLHQVPAEVTTTFENVYGPTGRVQYVRAVAPPIPARGSPPALAAGRPGAPRAGGPGGATGAGGGLPRGGDGGGHDAGLAAGLARRRAGAHQRPLAGGRAVSSPGWTP